MTLADEIAERNDEMAKGRIVKMKGNPYGVDRRSRWWGNPPAPEWTVAIEPLDVPLEIVLEDKDKASFGPAVRHVVTAPLAIVLADAYRYALDNLPFGEFGAHFNLSHGGKTLGTFSACKFGWELRSAP